MKKMIPGILGVLLLAPGSTWACAACFGKSDAPLAAGMNWGILSLLGFILFVLGGVAGFFVFLARRSSSTELQEDPSLFQQAEFENLPEHDPVPRIARDRQGRLTLANLHRHCRAAANPKLWAARRNRY